MKIVFFIFIFFSAMAYAQGPRKIAVILGGGRGSSDWANAVFSEQARGMMVNLASRGYEFEGSFGTKAMWNKTWGVDENIKGPWKNIEDSQLRDSLSKSVREFSKDTLEDTISALEKSVDSYAKGDQLIIQISNHGEPRTKGESSHSMALPTELINAPTEGHIDDTTEIEQNFPLDRLKTLIQKLVNKGVKVALLDFGCFSGNSLIMKSENICILSASNRTGPASIKENLTTAGSSFWSTLERTNNKNSSLEDIYLETRKNWMGEWNDIMEISTPEHDFIRPILDSVFAHEIFSFSKERTWAISEVFNCYNSIDILNADNFKMLSNLSKAIVNEELGREQLEMLREKQIQLAIDLDWLKEKEETPLASLPNADEGTRNKTNISFSDCRKFYDDQGSPKLVAGIDKLDAELETSHLCTENKRVLDFMKINIPEYLLRFNQAIEIQGKLKNISKKIKLKERPLYHELYQYFSKQNKSAPNACRDFKF